VVHDEKPPPKAYEQYRLLQLGQATVTEGSLKEESGYKALAGRGDRGISTGVNWAAVKGRKILGLDESALTKGPRDFVPMVTARAAAGEVRILAGLPDRQKATVKAVLASRPTRVKQAIGTVCTDRDEGFIKAVKEG